MSAYQQGHSKTETALILQGGGSLGAYECGAITTLYKHDIKFNIFAGSSIGAINASIIASAQNRGKDPADILKDFWQTLADNGAPFFPTFCGFPTLSSATDKMMAILSSIFSVAYGNPKAFMPRWFLPDLSNYFPYSWNYLYDTTPLKHTLNKYIDFRGLERNVFAEKDSARLILTAADIQKGQPVIFDSKENDIDIDNVVACASYPFYGIRWKEDDEGRYLWDGSLLTNTPMIEVIHASPMTDKKLYIVDVFPRSQKELPTNLIEVWHRARDIIYMDKTDRSLEILKEIEKYMVLLKKINTIVNSSEVQMDEKTRAKLREIEPEYHELAQRRGAIIKDVIRIGRIEKMHYLLEDADFSSYRINKLIREGQNDAERVLKEKERDGV